MILNMSEDMEQMYEEFKAGKIALYGLGTETEKALRRLGNHFEIVGLLDSFRIDGALYGKKIISFEDALNMGVRLIIVVARPGSCKAIAKRIGDQCRKEGIALMDIRGRDLLDIKKISYVFSDVNGVTRAELEEKIRFADVISFDLFDTLVMRQTLSSDDVAQYVDCRLREKGIFIENFCEKRQESEKELSRTAVPTLIEIYQNMLGRMHGKAADVTARKLADLEWNIDFSMLVPRKQVCDFFRDAMAAGKKVYVISDTYYSKVRLVEILKKCGITEYTDILSSSDYRISKKQGIYKVVKDQEPSKRYLHIGDDIVSDIENAHNCGFETCRVYSGMDLLEEVGMLGLSDYMDSLSDRLKVGMFVAKIFNSPFQFESGDGHIGIADVYDIGYLICAPLISDFVCWFHQKMREQRFQNIWFGARDGYLIQKMYSNLLEYDNQEDRTTYFLTSRTAAIRAGVKDENDIRYVDEMKFSGTLEACLKERFGIDAKSVKNEDILADETGLMKYKKAILENAGRKYKNYQKYISKLDSKEGDTAFFDFVAKGTTQMYIQRLTGNHLTGFYFLQLEKEHMKEKDIAVQSFYDADDTDTCGIYENYYILETVLTAPHPSVCGFNESGEPDYAVETRRKKDIVCFEKAQEGIFDYFKTYIRLCPEAQQNVNRKLDEVFLELVHKISLSDLDFLELVVEDPFFNRMTNIAEIL